MMTCKTKFQGPVAFRPEDVLDIPFGLFGFTGETQFLLLQVASSKPIVFIQSVRSANLCFISLPIQIVDSDYALSLNGPDLERLGYSEAKPPRLGEDVLCLAVLTIRDKEETTANLMAPIVIDIRAHCGVQALVANRYSPRHPFLLAEGQFTC
jgi:flagellar assembly factor FliW